MSRARHGLKPKGKMNDYSGSTDPNVVKEAMEKKHGGAVKKEVDKPEGKKPKARMDKRPRKAAGGRVSPWSSAASPKQNTEA